MTLFMSFFYSSSASILENPLSFSAAIKLIPIMVVRYCNYMCAEPSGAIFTDHGSAAFS